MRVDNRPLPNFPMQTLWTLPLNNLLTAPPAFDDVHGFFPIEGDRIVAYDLVTGTQLWIVSVATAMKPLAGGEFLFVVETNTIDAVRVTDGGSAWQLPFAEALAVPLVYDNGWLVAVTIHGSVRAYRANDGYLVWQRDIGSPAHAPPSFAANRVYVPTDDGRIVALRVDTGAPVWEKRLGGAPSEILALDDRLYVGSADNFLYCLDAADGERKWSVRAGADVIGRPLVDEDRVYFVALDNLLRGLSRRNGNQQWKRPLTLRPTEGPVKVGTTVAVTGLAPTLPAFDASDGGPAGELALGGEIAAAPHVTSVPGVWGPVIIVVARDLATGASVTAQARRIEPLIVPAMATLPKPVDMIAPATDPTVLDVLAPLPGVVRNAPAAVSPAGP